MTNLENKIENLKRKKENSNSSFLTDLKSHFLKKYEEIWEDIDSTYVIDMIREEIKEKENMIVFHNKNLSHSLERIQNIWDIVTVTDPSKKNNEYTVSINQSWFAQTVNLNEIYIVNNLDNYLDYLLEKDNERADKCINEYKEYIKEQEESKEKEKELVSNIKRFNKELNCNFTTDDRIKINKLLKVEKIKNNELSLLEMADLN